LRQVIDDIEHVEKLVSAALDHVDLAEDALAAYEKLTPYRRY
jgi:hypothetical protein